MKHTHNNELPRDNNVRNSTKSKAHFLQSYVTHHSCSSSLYSNPPWYLTSLSICVNPVILLGQFSLVIWYSGHTKSRESPTCRFAWFLPFIFLHHMTPPVLVALPGDHCYGPVTVTTWRSNEYVLTVSTTVCSFSWQMSFRPFGFQASGLKREGGGLFWLFVKPQIEP